MKAGDSRFGLPDDDEADAEFARTMEAIREAERNAHMLDNLPSWINGFRHG